MIILYCPKCDKVMGRLGEELAGIATPGYCARCETKMEFKSE